MKVTGSSQQLPAAADCRSHVLRPRMCNSRPHPPASPAPALDSQHCSWACRCLQSNTMWQGWLGHSTSVQLPSTSCATRVMERHG